MYLPHNTTFAHCGLLFVTEIDGVIQCHFYVVSFPFIVVLFDGIRKLTSIEVLWSLPLPTVPFFAFMWTFD